MLRNAWDKNEALSIHNFGHSIKGLAVMLSFERLAALAFKLEKTALKAVEDGNELDKSSVPSPEDLQNALDEAESACKLSNLFDT